MYLSLIVPVYNAGSFLSNSLEKLDAYLSKWREPVELILINDASPDDSNEILTKFSEISRCYSVIRLSNPKNMGKGFSVAKGMLAAKGKFRVFTDCDLAYPPSEIDKFVNSLKRGFDVAIACRVDKNSRYTISPAFFHYLYTRHLASRFFNWMLRKVLLPLCRDSQAGLKGFTANAAEKIFSQQKIHGFSFDIETLFIADQLNCLVEEIAVDFSYFDEPTTIKFAKDSFGVIKDIMRIKLWSMQKKYDLFGKQKQLIVTADDFGLSEKISAGIIDTCRNGIVNSFSVMPNTFGLQSSLDLIKPDLNVNIGIHFTLTHGKPLTKPSEIPSLVDEKGNFFPLNKFHLRSFLGMIDKNDVQKEIEAQFAFLKDKIKISHIDSHHHVHILPRVRDVVADIALKNGIKYVRAPHTPKSTWRSWLVSRFEGSYPQFWHRKGIHTSNNFFGFELGGRGNLLERWKTVLKNLPDGLTEIMVHPGLLDKETNDPYQDGRVVELNVLKNAELKAILCHCEPASGGRSNPVRSTGSPRSPLARSR